MGKLSVSHFFYGYAANALIIINDFLMVAILFFNIYILRKAAEQGVAVPGPEPASVTELAPFFDEEGWAVLAMFMRVPMQVKAAVEGLDLNLVARQFYEAAQAFHNYYHHFPVLQEPDERKRRARLLTVALFAALLRKGLRDLLGIPVPERM